MAVVRNLADDFVIEPLLLEYDENEKESEIYVKQTNTFYSKEDTEMLNSGFMKKYIFFAKKQIKPLLTDSSVEFISEAYKNLR